MSGPPLAVAGAHARARARTRPVEQRRRFEVAKGLPRIESEDAASSTCVAYVVKPFTTQKDEQRQLGPIVIVEAVFLQGSGLAQGPAVVQHIMHLICLLPSLLLWLHLFVPSRRTAPHRFEQSLLCRFSRGTIRNALRHAFQSAGIRRVDVHAAGMASLASAILCTAHDEDLSLPSEA